MKKMLKALLCLALVLSMATGCTVVNVASVGEVNGERVALSEYKYMLTFAELYFGAVDYDDEITALCMYDSYVSSYLYKDIAALVAEAGSAEPGKTVWEKELDGETVEAKLKSLVFDKAVELKLVEQKAAELGLALTEEESAEVTSMKTSFIENVFGTKTKLVEALKSINMTETELTDMWKNIKLISKLTDELVTEDKLTDEAIGQYYNDNYMRVKHILVKVGDDGIDDLDAAKAKADEIVAELGEGADFEALMNTYSSDVDSEGKVNGGETGYVFKEGDFGNPAFENASKELNAGEYSEPVLVEGSSYSGYHIIKRYALDEGYLANDQDGIKATVENAVKESIYEAEMTSLSENAEITKKDSKIKGVKLVKMEKAAEEEADSEE